MKAKKVYEEISNILKGKDEYDFFDISLEYDKIFGPSEIKWKSSIKKLEGKSIVITKARPYFKILDMETNVAVTVKKAFGENIMYPIIIEDMDGNKWYVEKESKIYIL